MTYRATLVGVLYKAAAVLCAVILLLCVIPFSWTFAKDVSSESDLKTALLNNEDIKLTKDIVVTGSSWTPYTYNGTFNGDGHVIKGLTTPMFQSLGATATVMELGVMAPPSIASGSGQNTVAFLAAESQGTILSCFAYGSIKYTGTGVVGGLIAEMKGGSVTDSFSCVDITAPSATYAGGMIGNMTGGSVVACYSSGAIHTNATCRTAGFANKVGGNVTNTYSSCQVRLSTPYAKASGVEGLFDNQMSLIRDDVNHRGVSTKELLANSFQSAQYSALSSNYFAITSTAYPMLKTFANAKWSADARDVVTVSTAAVALSDVTGESSRYEPTALSEAFVARTDYLTAATYADKTNIKSLHWSIDNTSCKLYDTVPVTERPNIAGDTFTVGTHASLLRSKLVFSSDADAAALTAKTGEASRTWYLTARLAQNPYFGAYFGDADTTAGSYPIGDINTLHYVRYYSLIGPACYRLTADLTLSNWLPIADFDGTFNGGDKTIYNLSIDKNYTGTDFGMFANTQMNATLRNLNLMNAKIDTGTYSQTTSVGALLGTAADNTSITAIVLYGDGNVIKGNANTGGLVGSSSLTSFKQCLVSVEVEAFGSVGGIVGYMNRGSLNQCGSTGYVACGASVGGLAGKIEGANVTVQDSYSTAMAVSDMSGAIVGGLIGQAGTAAFTRCYAANLADAMNGTAHPLRGTGTGTLSTTYFDVAYAQNADETAAEKRTTAEIMALTLSTSYWAKTSTNYPQILYFFNQDDSTYQDGLSKLSTTPIYVQNQWPNTSDDLTTGWIGSVSNLAKPTKLAKYDGGTAVIEALDSASGYMFEAGQEQRRIALMTKENTKISGIRVIAFVREDLIPIRYTVSGVGDAKAYVKLYYGSDEAGWKHYDVATVTAGTSEVLYNIPKGQRIKVAVFTNDAFIVNTVKTVSNNATVTMTLSSGNYTANMTFDQAVTVEIDLKANAPDWGLRRESY